MKAKRVYQIINASVAIVWLINGLYCKLLNGVPRHQEIVAEIMGEQYSWHLTKTIGVAEIFMAIWVLSRFRSRLNATTQIFIILTMNILEFILVPDLLLWGKCNFIFAMLFLAVVFYNEFVLNKK